MSASTAERAEIDIPDTAGDALVGHGATEPGDARTRLGADSTAPVKRRNGLMVTASMAVIVVAAAGVYWVSPLHRHLIRGGGVPSASAPLHATVVAPAASLAQAPMPTRVVPQVSAPIGGGDDMSQFLHDGGHPAPVAAGEHLAPATPSPAAKAAHPSPASDPNPLTPASAPAIGHPTTPPTWVANRSVVQATPAAPAAKTLPASAIVPASAPTASSAARATPLAATNAAQIASRLEPGKMTDAQQIQVLDLVTKLGTLVRNQNIRISELQSAVSGLQGRVDTSLTDFGRRLTLAEAAGAVNAAAAEPTASPTQAVGKRLPIVTTAGRVIIHPRAAADTGTHRYHIQAASPGLAMLSELDASGGEEAQLPVGPGDNLPGYGRVVSISQRGSEWMVKTEHGLIQ